MFKIYETLEEATHAQPRVTALLACQNNLMPASWHMPVSKSPFRYAIAVREENYTHTLLTERKSFTLNFLPFSYINEIDILGRVHGNEEDKLALSGLHVDSKDDHDNLLLEEADFIYSCQVCDTYVNGDHTIFIADVTKIYVKPAIKHAPALFMGKGTYTTTDTPKRIVRE